MVLLVDLLDVSGTLVSRIRDVIGSNPIILVGTKMDLLPKDTAPRCGGLVHVATGRPPLNPVV